MAAVEIDEALVFEKEWVERVKEMVYHTKPLANTGAIPRVATGMLKVKPEAYTPQFLSLGPYHHWKLENGNYQNRELKMSTAEASKVKSAAAFSKKLLDSGKRLNDIVEMIESMQPEIELFYDWKIMDSNNFVLMMAVDSFFLLRFLFSLSGHERDDNSADIDLSPLHVCIKWDILKLENQIPLSLLREVFDNVKEAALFHQDFNQLLQNAYTELSPFEQFGIDVNVATDQSHLLGCFQGFVSPLLKIQAVEMENGQKPTLLQSMKHFTDGVIATVVSVFITHPTNRGQRDLNSYTLYLPRFTLSDIETEVFLRNMLVLEFNDAARSNSVTRYVGLMDCLIDTPDDVRLLRSSNVIRRRSLKLTDESIAEMWNGMCQPFFTGQLEPPEELKLVLEEVLITEYYKSQIKKVLHEFY